ncbi:TIGR03943 family putative permease subunit [Roseofilum casamattae]|uniref:TIGR03943 family protein n=1 Tax=Roseofilum casamattae BLCC-M143 TaxID=3022442 RepID=A0ABT7C3L1_9CYAN|nr:TIGR03943 family protein [Roseofilum casamattae]MDJ1185374.1 TIGR03943 family protein [Roseofilum casamattae BLCC-M143]
MLDRLNFPQRWLPTLDVLTTGLWGLVLMKFWITGELNLLIHPAYHWLTVIAGVILIALSSFKGWQLWRRYQTRLANRSRTSLKAAEHSTLLPQSLSCYLLIFAAMVALTVRPHAFTSETALKRGVNDFLPVTQVTPQSFANAASRQGLSLVEWVRTLNVYPEPDAYTGEDASVQGFAIHPPDFPEDYILLARFVVTCCAADAYPVGLPVYLPDGDRDRYPEDGWLDVTGVMETHVLNDRRKLVIKANTIESIPEPKNPYNY